MQTITSAEVLVVGDSLTDAELTVHALKIGEVMPTTIWMSSADESLLYMFRDKHYAYLEPASPRRNPGNKQRRVARALTKREEISLSFLDRSCFACNIR